MFRMIIIRKLEISRSEDFIKVFLTTENQGKEYNQEIDLNDGEIIRWNCDCAFGSVWRFNEKYREKKCKHAKAVIRLLVFLHYLKPEELEK